MLILFAAVALAWERNDADWSSQVAPVEELLLFNADSFSGGGIAPDDAEAAYLRALDVWNAESGADVYLEYGGRTASTVAGGGDNGENVVFYGDFTLSAGIAVTTWGYAGSAMTDCDTEFHSANLYGTLDWYAASGDEDAPAGQFDLVHTLVHETGHCLGLGHSEDDDAIMRPFNSTGTGEESRHLHPDDQAGIRAIYGAVAPDLVFGEADVPGPVHAGDVVEVSVPVENVGDGTAWHVVAIVDGTEVREVGEIASDTPVGNRIGPSERAIAFEWTALCGGFEIALQDVSGSLWDTFVDVDCAGRAGEETPAACGCAAGTAGGSGTGSLALGAVAATLALRLRSRGEGRLARCCRG